MPVAQGPVVVAGINLIKPFGILHSSVYTFFEKMSVIELNADVETGNWKFEIRQRIYIFVFSPISNFKFQISSFTAKIQEQQSVNYF